MDAIADLADRYSASAKSASATSRILRCRMSRSATCRRCGARSTQSALATPNVNLVSDIIACPGLDYCSLANARSIPVAQEIVQALRATSTSRATSAGCTSTFPAASMPAAIITSATSAFSASRRTARSSIRSPSAAAPTSRPQLGTLIGPAVPYDEVADVVEDIAEAYLELRERPEELFIDTVKRLGVEPFKERVYATR